MVIVRRGGLARFALLTVWAAGCAGLEAKKVPLADRMTGADDKVHGFRYYLPRPYAVVGERICVGQHVSVGYLYLLNSDKKAVILETYDEAGTPRYFDARGNSVSVTRDQLTPLVEKSPPPTPDTGMGMVTGPETGMGGTPGTTPKTDKKNTTGADIQRRGASAEIEPVSLADKQFSITGLTEAELRAILNPPGAGGSPPPIQFITLPDFEEQMAIKDCNFAAYSKYAVQFADGWQLRAVNGSFDSTEVAVRALQVLSNAISASAAVRKEQLDKLPALTQKSSGADLGDAGTKPQRGVRVQSQYIEPGMYRMTKGSERQSGKAEGTVGLISELGLPVISDVKVMMLK